MRRTASREAPTGPLKADERSAPGDPFERESETASASVRGHENDDFGDREELAGTPPRSPKSTSDSTPETIAKTVPEAAPVGAFFLKTETPAITARDVGISRGERVILEKLSFEVRRGTAVHLAGSNGRGKTTLLYALSGLVEIDRGSLRILGRETGKRGASFDEPPFHLLGHKLALKEDWSVEDNVGIPLGLMGIKIDPPTLDAALAEWGLPGARAVLLKRLSQGQKRKIAIVKLLLAPKRPVWLLDEPFDGLDPEARAALAQAINAHSARGGACLFTHHFELPSSLKIESAIRLDDFQAQSEGQIPSDAGDGWAEWDEEDDWDGGDDENEAKDDDGDVARGGRPSA